MDLNEKDVLTWVLRNIRIFWFIQEFDHYRQSGDSSSQNVMSRFAEWEGSGDVLNDLELMSLDTALGILFPIFAYSVNIKSKDWKNANFLIQPHYKCITFDKNGKPCTLSTERFLRIMRNALAHYADFVSDRNKRQTVFFEPKVIRLSGAGNFFESHDGQLK